MNTARKSGMAVLTIMARPKPRMGMTAANTNASCLPTRMDMMTAKISISGARTAVRMSIM